MKNNGLYFKIESFPHHSKINHKIVILETTEGYYNRWGKPLNNFKKYDSYILFLENGIIAKSATMGKNWAISFIFLHHLKISDVESLSNQNILITERSLRNKYAQKYYKIYKKLISLNSHKKIFMYYDGFLHSLELTYIYCRIL